MLPVSNLCQQFLLEYSDAPGMLPCSEVIKKFISLLYPNPHGLVVTGDALTDTVRGALYRSPMHFSVQANLAIKIGYQGPSLIEGVYDI